MMKRTTVVVLLVILVLQWKTSFSMVKFANLRIPENPCPGVFSYKNDRGIYYGEIAIPYDGSSEMTLTVNVSLIGLYDQLAVRLQSLTPINLIVENQNLRYRVDFPVQNVIPKIVQIVYNGNIYCSGPPENLGFEGVTNLWASLTMKIHQHSYPIAPITSRPLQNQIETTPTTTTTKQPEFESKFPSDSSGSDVESCGIPLDIRTLVLKGEKSLENEFPWLVAMFYRFGVSYQFKCTANLISKQHIITAGHCVQFYNAPLIPKEDILLVLERHDLSHWATTGATIRTAEEVFVHPNYQQSTAHYDIAVIKMNQKVSFKISVRPVCLWMSDARLGAVVGLNGTVAGWGKDENGRETVPEPRKAVMPIVSQEECLRSNPMFVNLTSDTTFCAGNRDGSGPCTGDSGAGLVVNVAGRFYLRGLVSTAIKLENSLSCNLDEFIVFADVAKVRDWIQTMISK